MDTLRVDTDIVRWFSSVRCPFSSCIRLNDHVVIKIFVELLLFHQIASNIYPHFISWPIDGT